MRKVRIENGQVLDSRDFNKFGYLMQEGLQELLVYLLGGAGTVVTGLECSYGGADRAVDIGAGVGVAPGGSPFKGALIVEGGRTINLEANPGPGNRYDLIQIAYREAAGSPESRVFLNPSSQFEYLQATQTEMLPQPVVSVITDTNPGISPSPGWLPLAECTVLPGATIIGSNNIQDRRYLRTDGLRDLYRFRSASSNTGDSPAPSTFGGGKVWVEVQHEHYDGEDEGDANKILLDSSMDWRDRYIWFWGHISTGYATYMSRISVSETETILARLKEIGAVPGGPADEWINGEINTYGQILSPFDDSDPTVNEAFHMAGGFLYTGEGYEGPDWVAALENMGLKYWDASGEQLMANIWCDRQGFLRMKTTQDLYCALCVSYSPRQNHH